MPHISQQQLDLERRLRHDIANDLTAIAMALDALALVRDDAEQFEELLNLAKRNLEALGRNVDRLNASRARDATSA